MTKRKYADRLTLEEALEKAAYISEQRRENKCLLSAERIGMGILNLSVRDFYAACLKARRASDKTAARTQAWIADCIEAALGESDTSTLTMRELANRIADAVDMVSITSEDRWMLYELCFMLTAEMRAEAGTLTFRDETVRLGTPGVSEPSALYSRVKDLQENRKARPQKKEAPARRRSLEQVFQSARGTADADWSSGETVRILPADIFVRRFLAAKFHDDPSRACDLQDQMVMYMRFKDVVRTYSGREWSSGLSLPFFTGNITTALREKAREQEVALHEVMQTYELCYEFINLMADVVHSLCHRSLMLREGMDGRFDYDELQEIEFMAEAEQALQEQEDI